MGINHMPPLYYYNNLSIAANYNYMTTILICVNLTILYSLYFAMSTIRIFYLI